VRRYYRANTMFGGPKNGRKRKKGSLKGKEGPGMKLRGEYRAKLGKGLGGKRN